MIITYTMFRAEICHGNLTYIRVSPTAGTSADSADKCTSRSSIVTVKWLMPCTACQIHNASCAPSGSLADATALTVIVSAETLSLSPYVWFGHWPGQMDMHPSLLEATITVAHRADICLLIKCRLKPPRAFSPFIFKASELRFQLFVRKNWKQVVCEWRSLPPNLRMCFTLGICQLIAARLLWKQSGLIVEEGMGFITECQAGKSKYL